MRISLKAGLKRQLCKMENNKKKPGKQGSSAKIAVVRVRGSIKSSSDVECTMQQLKLFNNNFCTVVNDNDLTQGMIRKVKDYITWGEIDEETFGLMLKARGEEYTGRLQDKAEKISYNKFFEHSGKKYKRFFRLSPPKKGFGRKGIKFPFTNGGALGYRGQKINELLKRMI